MNLPVFGAVASGLFAEHGLDVALVGPSPRPPITAPAAVDQGPAAPPPNGAPGRPVGASAAPSAPAGPARPDVALTSVQGRIRARAGRPEPARSRFVAVVHQRSPLAAFVKEDSPLRYPADLEGARVAASTSPWFDQEFDAGLEAMGIGPAVRVPGREDGRRHSLARGEVEVIGSWDEAIAVIRRRAEVPVRSIPFGPPQVYTTGVEAGDHVPTEVVVRMVAALRAAFEQQRVEPELGLEDLCRRFPAADPDGALEEWSVLEDYVFATGQPLAMTDVQWEATVAHAARTYAFTPVPVAELCREEMVGTSTGGRAG